MSNILLFVYGTLKSGEPYHYLMKDELGGTCELFKSRKAVTVISILSLWHPGLMHPYLLYLPGQGHHVEGELYEVDKTRLEILDGLEAHPEFYERHKVHVTLDGTSGPEVEAQAYFLVKYRSYMLDLPFLKSYTSNVEGKRYVSPKDRPTGTLKYWHEVHTSHEKPEQ
ncbi:gamma-glutamylaminecyclotransferase-like isoform X2 [Dreissena polymorpha]|uniref:gamma-glutamylaminecyclotransferase-like isoform X2 n=1 Tax=Dreissena polymorpha TaxID=45954 RepID=UPI00226491B1|nr:gamma-glutamylaminecyclotransferase-like isoform X2 [Dreissena polymorpha]